MSTHVTAAVSEYIAGARLEDVPEEVLVAAKEHVLDTLACAVGAAGLAVCRPVVDVFAEAGGVPESRVPGTEHRLPRAAAAYVGSYLSNALDFDDTHVRRGHPGSAIVPPALACADAEDATGAELLLAVVVGYEVCLRLTAAITPSRERYATVSGLATRQVLGAVAAVSRLIGLDAARTANALGLGAVNAPVPSTHKIGLTPSERPISSVKNNYAAASMGAVLGCQLAARGFEGSRSILDGPRGFWAMAGSDRFSADEALDGLGETYLLPKTGLKPYACCRWIHTALDAGAEVHRERAIAPGEIARIEVHTFDQLFERFWGVRPRSIFDAQYDLPYVLALELLGRSSSRGLREADLLDPELLRLCDRTVLHHDEAADERFYGEGRLPVRLVVHFADGQVIERRCEIPTGDPGGPPFGREARLAKARALLEPRLGAERAARLETIALELEHHRVRDLLAQTVPQRSPAGA
jgi:2-methylcitrate dehydratase PrpD